MLREEISALYMKRKIKNFRKKCQICQKVKYLNKKYNSIYQPILVEKPRQLLSMDFYGPLPTSTGGVKYLFTTIDVFKICTCVSDTQGDNKYSLEQSNNKSGNKQFFWYSGNLAVLSLRADHSNTISKRRLFLSLSSILSQPQIFKTRIKNSIP